MRVLIIASPRTGSSELASRLGRYLSLKIYQEPFNTRTDSITYNLENNAVVKCIVHQLPNVHNLPNNFTSTKKEIIDYWKEYLTNFDRTILLNRRVIKDQVESWHYFLSSRVKEEASIHNIRYSNKPYVYSRQKESDFTTDKKYILLTNQLIKRLSYETSIPITYFEDLYKLDGQRFRQYPEKTL